MSRAAGKHAPRDPNTPQPDPGTPEGNYIGVSDHQIPGGQNHLANPVTTRQKVPVPETRPEFRGMMAHGVDAPAHHHDRQGVDHAKVTETYAPKPDPIHPVPVVIIAQAGGDETILAASPRHFSLQASTGEPTRICGTDRTRTRVLLLNESTSSDIRFAQRETDLIAGGGALLPWPGNSYLALRTQSELYAISKDSGTPAISVIQEFEQKW